MVGVCRNSGGHATIDRMNCDYFTRGECVSCVHIDIPYVEQVARRQKHVEQLLGSLLNATHMHWLPAATSSQSGFRTKAKMAVGGTREQPTLGLLDQEWRGVDLSACPILHPSIRAALPALKNFIRNNNIPPYNVATRQGELKYILITADVSQVDGGQARGLLIRFVLRSRACEALIRSRLPRLLERIPQARVVTINVHPKHAAVVEGALELVLTDAQTMPLTVGDVQLRVGPRSFTQTNTEVAGELYRCVARWACGGVINEGGASTLRQEKMDTLWDLYCGVGGFALHASKAGVCHVTGVEISDAAIEAAKTAAVDLLGEAAGSATTFIAGDATAWAMRQKQIPDVVIVNPPRRGIGQTLAQWLNQSGVRRLVYSSCNPETLAKDLQAMSNYRVLEGRLFDMFPHTDHAEVAVLCEKAAPRHGA